MNKWPASWPAKIYYVKTDYYTVDFYKFKISLTTSVFLITAVQRSRRRYFGLLNLLVKEQLLA